ncbi:uncharacterized protein PAC_10073 [Phialocephala subalpina]|uniref:2EXR domain-containing protein n=1 Tax=Phialocephala subalpina TaxID=576137 RepID=A0A1L7X5A4_9HELO|nr:uncharacterized protein PAC_10073 [Phialocephala subalpina]
MASSLADPQTINQDLLDRDPCIDGLGEESDTFGDQSRDSRSLYDPDNVLCAHQVDVFTPFDRLLIDLRFLTWESTFKTRIETLETAPVLNSTIGSSSPDRMVSCRSEHFHRDLPDPNNVLYPQKLNVFTPLPAVSNFRDRLVCTCQSENFRQDLPDPDNVLYPQKLDIFTLFPELPKELRSIIWESTFQPRRVPLQTEPCDRMETGPGIYEDREHLGWLSREHFPAALGVNCESRQTALRAGYIKLLDLSDERFEYLGGGALYFHPELDTLILPDIDVFFSGRYLRANTEFIQNALLKVQNLELHGFCWDKNGVLDVIFRSVDLNGFIPPRSQEWRDNFVGGYFTGLRRIALVTTGRIIAENGMVVSRLKLDGYRKEEGESGLDTWQAQNECRNAMEVFFRNKTRNIPGFKVPEVTIVVPQS